MKIYTDINESNDKVKYWSNATADLYNPEKGTSIDEDDLPEELRSPYEYLSDNYGMYTYLMRYDGHNGFALVNEFYEYTSEGNEKDVNNYDRAVTVAKNIEKKFPQFTVFINKQMGFPNTLPDGTKDNATELIVFINSNFFTKENEDEFYKLVKYLSENAYVNYPALRLMP